MSNSLYTKLIFYITVPKCVYCKSKLQIDDKALCKECLKIYNENKLINCPLCAKTYDKCSCPNDFLNKHGVKSLYKVFKYKAREKSPQNSLIFALKQENRHDVFTFLSDELSRSIQFSNPDLSKLVITNIPRRKSSINRYGYDHARVLAQQISKNLKIPYLNLLKSNAEIAQKEMKSKDRLQNVSLEIRNDDISLKGKHIVIVDDIVTTGSSMSVASMLLRSIGASKVYGATLAIAYRDDKLILDESDRFK